MDADPLEAIGHALRARRRARRLTQPELASRLGRSPARISELENGLVRGKIGRDRLGLLAEASDALELVPMLVPREHAKAVHRLLQDSDHAPAPLASSRVFDELFVDLSEPSEDDLR